KLFVNSDRKSSQSSREPQIELQEQSRRCITRTGQFLGK
ncbi:unnamed protein product, partial [Brassica napus]